MRKECRIYGSGGQGVITLGHLIGSAAIQDNKEAVMTEEYSPYITGGWSRADLILSDRKIDHPLVVELDYLIALNQEGFDENIRSVKSDGIVFTDSGTVDWHNSYGKRVISMPARELAGKIGRPQSANIILFGLFSGTTGIPGRDSCLSAIASRFPKHKSGNAEAFDLGFNAGEKLE